MMRKVTSRVRSLFSKGNPSSSLHSVFCVKKRFTLIELLVVVSIIAILAGMLLPALNSARERGMSIRCTGNLKQLGTALDLYASSNDDFCILIADMANKNLWCGTSKSGDGMGGNIVAEGGLNEYLGKSGENGVRCCPTASKTLSATGSNYGNGGYGYNPCLGSINWMTYTENHARLNRIRNSSSVISFGDAALLTEGKLCQYYSLEPVTYEYMGFAGMPQPSMHFRHSRKVNLVMVDGHAETRGPVLLSNSAQSMEFGLGWFMAAGDENRKFFYAEAF